MKKYETEISNIIDDMARDFLACGTQAKLEFLPYDYLKNSIIHIDYVPDNYEFADVEQAIAELVWGNDRLLGYYDRVSDYITGYKTAYNTYTAGEPTDTPAWLYIHWLSNLVNE